MILNSNFFFGTLSTNLSVNRKKVLTKFQECLTEVLNFSFENSESELINVFKKISFNSNWKNNETKGIFTLTKQITAHEMNESKLKNNEIRKKKT